MPRPMLFAARKTLNMPAAAPRKKKTINPQGRVPKARSNNQPSARATQNDATSSVAMRNPRPSAPCGSAARPVASCRNRSRRALSISAASRASLSGGRSSLIQASAAICHAVRLRCGCTAAHHSKAPRAVNAAGPEVVGSACMALCYSRSRRPCRSARRHRAHGNLPAPWDYAEHRITPSSSRTLSASASSPALLPPRPAVSGSDANQDSVHRTARRRRSSSWQRLV